MASWFWHGEILARLVAGNTDVTIYEKDGTPITMTAFGGYISMYQTSLHYAGEVRERDETGRGAAF